jgi:FkbM family methyltransferase
MWGQPHRNLLSLQPARYNEGYLGIKWGEVVLRRIYKLIQLMPYPIYRRGLWFGVGATVEHAKFLASHRFRTIIDGGANKGQFALAVIKHYPDAKIIAFEPLSQPAELFEKVFAGVLNVALVRAALGNSEGLVDIHVSRRDDSSSLLPIGKLQSQVFPGTETHAVEKVRVTRLDCIIDVKELLHPVLLKIDVQGFELEVLKGAERTLREIDGIYVELSFMQLYENQPLSWEVINWLRERGFVLTGVYHLAMDSSGRAVQADFYFTRAEG